jgi:hypothetical protein
LEPQGFTQEEIQESDEFKKFMAYHTIWQFKHVFAQIESGRRLDIEEMKSIKNEFELNQVPKLNSKRMKDFISWYNYTDPVKFALDFNAYGKAKSSMLTKFPQLIEVSNRQLLINAQDNFLENFAAENYKSTNSLLRNDEPNNIDFSFTMPNCFWNAEYETVPGGDSFFTCSELTNTNEDQETFNGCPNFVSGGCQGFYNQCVFEEQDQFIRGLSSCLGGGEFVYYDVADVADGNCYWTVAGPGQESEYVCPGNSNGVGGFTTLISILEGPYPSDDDNVPSGNGTLFSESCLESIMCTYYATVCSRCVGKTITEGDCCQ